MLKTIDLHRQFVIPLIEIDPCNFDRVHHAQREAAIAIMEKAIGLNDNITIVINQSVTDTIYIGEPCKLVQVNAQVVWVEQPEG